MDRLPFPPAFMGAPISISPESMDLCVECRGKDGVWSYIVVRNDGQMIVCHHLATAKERGEFLAELFPA